MRDNEEAGGVVCVVAVADLVCGRKDGSALALGMERALARGCGFGVGRFLDSNTEHRLVQRPLEAKGRAD